MDIKLATEVLEAAEHSHSGLTVEGLPRFYMGSWVNVLELMDDEDEPRIPLAQIKEGGCNTSACLAGYVTLLRAPAGTTTNGEDLFDAAGEWIGDFAIFARRELDIDPERASTLFYTTDETAIARLRYLIQRPDASPEKLLRINVDIDEGGH